MTADGAMAESFLVLVGLCLGGGLLLLFRLGLLLLFLRGLGFLLGLLGGFGLLVREVRRYLVLLLDQADLHPARGLLYAVRPEVGGQRGAQQYPLLVRLHVRGDESPEHLD